MANILFLTHEGKDKDYSVSKSIIDFVIEKGCNVFADPKLAAKTGCEEYVDQPIDFAIVLGGDGTILKAAHQYSNKRIAFFGINIGRVGCLADATLDNCRERIEKILNGKSYVEERNVINCRIYEKGELVAEKLAFNEVVINRGELFKMLLINLEINNHHRTSFYSDGIIVATATGSSAYSLSSGGPMLSPNAKSFAITPIAAQSRSIASLVVNDTDTVKIDIHEKVIREDFSNAQPIIFVDGAFRYKVSKDTVVEISKSNATLSIVKTDFESSLFETMDKVSLSNLNIFSNKN